MFREVTSDCAGGLSDLGYRDLELQFCTTEFLAPMVHFVRLRKIDLKLISTMTLSQIIHDSSISLGLWSDFFQNCLEFSRNIVPNPWV